MLTSLRMQFLIIQILWHDWSYVLKLKLFDGNTHLYPEDERVSAMKLHFLREALISIQIGDVSIIHKPALQWCYGVTIAWTHLEHFDTMETQLWLTRRVIIGNLKVMNFDNCKQICIVNMMHRNHITASWLMEVIFPIVAVWERHKQQRIFFSKFLKRFCSYGS